MKKKTVVLWSLLVAGVVLYFFLQTIPLRVSRKGIPGFLTKPLLPAEAEAMARIRHIGVWGDRMRLNEVIKGLDHESERVRAVAALIAGRLGVQEAREKLQKLTGNRLEDASAAKIALARLNAKAYQTNITAQVRSFLSALGFSIMSLNLSVGWEKKMSDMPISLETLALREVAGMVAEANRQGEDTTAMEQEIAFEMDYASALKVSLSKMKQKQRIAFLINNILTLPPTGERYYDAQALADEGHAAVPAIVAALTEIHNEIKRNGFTRAGGAAHLLMDALRCIGSPKALPILQKFETQPGIIWYGGPEKGKPDRFIRASAQVAIRDIKEGRRYCLVHFYPTEGHP